MSTQPEPTKIRAQMQGDKAIVRMLMVHDMETGQRKEPSGKLVPAWFIQEVVVSHNGKPVLTAQWGTGISKNPFLQVTLRGAKAGDKVSEAWVDNRGAKRSDEAAILEAAPAR